MADTLPGRMSEGTGISCGASGLELSVSRLSALFRTRGPGFPENGGNLEDAAEKTEDSGTDTPVRDQGPPE